MVSIILTSYNHGAYLKEAIESVLNQTFTNFEFIIWDDASTDNSWEIINSYDDERIKAYRNEVSQRGVYGINKAISEVAKGQYIAIHHSDDIWEPTKLEKQVKYLESHPDIGAVFTNAMAIDEKSNPFENKEHFYYSIFNQANRTRYEWLNYFFYQGNVLCHPSVLIRKECYQSCGPYRYGLAQLGDFDMWIRLCMQYEIHILSEQLVHFRVRDNASNSSGETPLNKIRMFNEHSVIMQNYLNIASCELLLKIFPQASIYNVNGECIPLYGLAMMALDVQNWRDLNLLGLNLLYKIVNDKELSQCAKIVYDFDYLKLVQLSAQYNVFSVVADEISYIKSSMEINEKSQKAECFYVLDTVDVQKYVFDLSHVEIGAPFILFLLEKSCVVEIERITLVFPNKHPIECKPYFTNALKEEKNTYYFETESPQIHFNFNTIINFREAKLELEIRYMNKDANALQECIRVIKQDKLSLLHKLNSQNENYRLVYFGASSGLEKVYQDLKKEGIVPDFICDNSHLKQGTFFKQHTISSPDDILLQNYDFIVVITSSYVEEIKLQLHKYNTIFDIYDLVESR